MPTPTDTRRQYLLSLGTVGVAAIAGCTSGTDDADDGTTTDTTDTEDASDDAGTTTQQSETPGRTTTVGSEPDVCADMTTAGYTRYHESDSPFVGTFEYPAPATEKEGPGTTGRFNNTYSVTIKKYIGDDQEVHVYPTQYVDGSSSQTPIQRGEGAGLEQVGELSFGGETVPIVRAEAKASGDDVVNYYNQHPYYIVGLPFEGSEKRYYRFDARMTVQFADDLEAPVCTQTFEDVSKRMIESLEPNPDTTVESVGTE